MQQERVQLAGLHAWSRSCTIQWHHAVSTVLEIAVKLICTKRSKFDWDEGPPWQLAVISWKCSFSGSRLLGGV